MERYSGQKTENTTCMEDETKPVTEEGSKCDVSIARQLRQYSKKHGQKLANHKTMLLNQS